MCQFLFLGSPRLSQFPALDIRAKETLDVDLPVEEIFSDLLALLMTFVRFSPQTFFYVIRRKDFGQFVISLYEMVVSGFQHCHRFYFICHISL